MAEQLTVGLPFNLDESWMGGAYYLQNVLAALATLDEAAQPQVAIITNTPGSFEFMQKSGYRKLTLAVDEHILRNSRRCGINILFAYSLPGMEAQTLSWIPDFQERHLGYLFTDEEIAGRTAWHLECLKSAGLLLSSNSAYGDLVEFYDPAKIPVFVVPFATFLPTERPPRRDVIIHYRLPDRYFFAPNQFWIHKNHIVILAALKALGERGIRPHVCFSGKEFDSRADDYATYLRELASEWGVAEQILFLGFMPRADQIVVMDEAIAVLQPSRFEGWSTVIEDAKAINQYVLASSLDVHREQLTRNCDFFDPSSVSQLAALMERYWTESPHREGADYGVAQRRFGQALLNTFTVLARANPLRAISDPASMSDQAPLPVGTLTDVGSGSPIALNILGVGWAHAEDTHCWSIGPHAELWVQAEARAETVRLHVSGNPHVENGWQDVIIRINGGPPVATEMLHSGRIELDLGRDAAGWQQGGLNRISLDLDKVAVPPAHTGDTRMLGLCLWQIEIR